jgi:hypothetical protein
VVKDGVLYPSVVAWNRVIIDTIDFEQNPVIEVLEMTPAQLRQNEGYDQEVVEALIQSQSTRETIDQEQQDTKTGYIRIYEIHGNLPTSYLDPDATEESKDYTQQMHVVSFVQGENGTYNDFSLAQGKEKESPYRITHLIKEDGRSQAKGAVENLFESQWMVNHTAKAIKDQLDLASKLVFQTSDATFVGQNALSAIENGDILIHAPNQPLTQMQNNSHDITSLQNFQTSWKALGNEIVGISEAMLGVTPKSGTAWRQTEAILQESHDLFELMTENKGLALEDFLRTIILPHIRKTSLSNTDELVAMLEDADLKKIDSAYIKAETKKRVAREAIDSLVQGEIPVNLNVPATAESVQSELQDLGNMRSFITSEITPIEWKEYFKDFEWDVEVDVTGEAYDTQANLTTLTTVLQTIASNPMVLSDPNGKLVFNKILNMVGTISPAEISQSSPIPQV